MSAMMRPDRVLRIRSSPSTGEILTKFVKTEIYLFQPMELANRSMDCSVSLPSLTSHS